MGSDGVEDLIRHTVATCTSQTGWLKAWNKSRRFVLDGEDWCDVRHEQLIITPGVTVKEEVIISSIP